MKTLFLVVTLVVLAGCSTFGMDSTHTPSDSTNDYGGIYRGGAN